MSNEAHRLYTHTHTHTHDKLKHTHLYGTLPECFEVEY